MRGTAPNLTIEENLALAYSRSKRGPLHFALNKKDTAMFREALARYNMGLEDRMDAKVGLLSGGSAAGGNLTDVYAGAAQAAAFR